MVQQLENYHVVQDVLVLVEVVNPLMLLKLNVLELYLQYVLIQWMVVIVILQILLLIIVGNKNIFLNIK